jgi:Tol biopolymer transport system component/predicted Ser/Thr protein kinase
MIGQTLGHYRIESKLGEGGMGVVYRALDTHLNRPAAIKVLRAEAMMDPDRKRRFVQEAQAASALNHPNIITIYDINQADGADFMAMEYVAGKTLDQVIPRNGLRLGETLKYAVQIADALARAHAAGIIHRDIKPGNIMVTDVGLVKVLDFGLAKLTESGEMDEAAETQALRAERPPRTEEGAIVGTVAYMSPEQAEGKKIDARSDIFSFGSLLYEMVTGRRAFQGETKISTLATILHKEPQPVSEIVPDTPLDLEKTIARCLRKDPARRLQHMDDVKTLLEDLKEESESGKLASSPGAAVPSQRRYVRPAIAAAVLLIAAAGATWWWLRPAPPPAPQLALTRLTSDSGLTTEPALSPDGKLLAYASDRSGEGNLDIWVQQVAGGAPIRLTTDPADDSAPVFSPDGSQMAFRSEREGGGSYIIPALGGEPRLLAKSGRNPRYSPDGKRIAYWVGEAHAGIPRRIQVMASTGGPPKPLEFHPPIRFTDFPVWSPDGKYLLFLGQDQAPAGTEWWVASVETGAAVKTGAFDAFRRQGIITSPGPPVPAEWVGDQIFFSARLGDGAGLWQVSISPETWQITGPARRLTFGTGLDTNPSVSTSGRLAFSSLAENLDVWSLPIDANQAKPRGDLQRLTQDPAADVQPSITADGKRMVFSSNRAGTRNVWLKDLETGRESPLNVDPIVENPLIAADGSKAAYVVNSDKQRIHVMAIGPGGRPGVSEIVCEDCGHFLADVSPDGKRVLYFVSKTIFALSIASGERTVLLQHQKYNLSDPRFSADGRWVAFHMQIDPLRRQMFIAPSRPGAPEKEWIPITDGSAMDRFAAWSPDGNVLYWISERDGFRCIVAQRLDPGRKKPVGPLLYIQHLHSARRSMMSFADPTWGRVSVVRDKIVFTLAERAGNIWMTELGPQK